MVFDIHLSSICTHLWSLWLVHGLITALGMRMCFCSGIVALLTWFDDSKIGVAMGLSVAGSCIGGIVYILHFWQSHRFRTTMLIPGGVAAATMIPPNFVFRIRGQNNRSRPGRGGSRVFPQPKLTWRSFAELSYLLAAGGMLFAFLGVYFGFVNITSFASTLLRTYSSRTQRRRTSLSSCSRLIYQSASRQRSSVTSASDHSTPTFPARSSAAPSSGSGQRVASVRVV